MCFGLFTNLVSADFRKAAPCLSMLALETDRSVNDGPLLATNIRSLELCMKRRSAPISCTNEIAGLHGSDC